MEAEPCQVRDREREQQAPWTLPSKTKILPALPPKFHSPFLILSRAGKGEVDDRVPLVCPDFWYKLPLTLDLAVKSFPTLLHPFLDLSKCQPPRLVQTPQSASAPALSPWSVSAPAPVTWPARCGCGRWRAMGRASTSTSTSPRWAALHNLLPTLVLPGPPSPSPRKHVALPPSAPRREV